MDGAAAMRLVIRCYSRSTRGASCAVSGGYEMTGGYGLVKGDEIREEYFHARAAGDVEQPGKSRSEDGGKKKRNKGSCENQSCCDDEDDLQFKRTERRKSHRRYTQRFGKK